MPIADLSAIIHGLTDTKALATLLDALPLGIAIMDTRGKLLAINSAYEKITGVQRKDVLGIKCLHALRCDFCMKNCPIMTDWENHDPKTVEANILTRNREKVFVNLTLSPLVDDTTTIQGVIETITPSSGGPLDEVSGHVLGLGELVGRSPQVRKIFAMTPSIAQTDSPVLITGETGTGKDMLAEEIHNESDRDGPFVKVNCGALPPPLLESELFGHIKNAFPGADQAKQGRLRMAHGGTLFITEIGDLPLSLQTKLLAYMDNHVVRPMGSTKSVRTDVRLMAASNTNLDDAVRNKTFRQDLLYRLNVIRLHLPPLRERGEDLLLLQDHFLRMFQLRYKKKVERFSKNVDKLLKSYTFPGNIRELRNLIEYAVNFCDTPVIRMRHLPGYILHGHGLPTNLTPSTQRPDIPGEVRSAPPERWEDVQRKMILDALVKTGGRKQQAAELLGWGRSTLWRKMKHFGIE
ncbi:PAS domain-containing protein [Pseudodesulfovibrio sp. JC047]|uniref:sigma-54 interaction domain-containing protein n=1 Tax=Pseudodesulfovibrio sp. JC047 TaxID=2683199 RepID=UPI0013D0C5D4|nr:sigma 54-interacting transcriptional regulator [Pseudodesulfovibrio sp. JC047]NDV19626.1 PAS domain-containing protein [Pseudodesulfovibrio sp. JC047]